MNILTTYTLKYLRLNRKRTAVTVLGVIGRACGRGQRRFRSEINSKEFFINDLKFILSYPVVEHQGEPCISRMDLTKLIALSLRIRREPA